MSIRRLFALVLAGMLLLAACQAAPPPSEPSSSRPESAPEQPAPAPAEPERPDVAAPAVYFPVFEYHNSLRENDVPDLCRVVIPRLEAAPGPGQELPDLTQANAPLEELQRTWEEFRDSRGHQYDGTMEVTSCPFTDRRWVQVVVHVDQYPAYNDRERMLSANFDKDRGCVVTAGEQLAEMGLTLQSLLERLNQQDIPALLYWEAGAKGSAKDLELQAFRGREDGSAVFFLRAELSARTPDGAEEDREEFLAYDTRGEEFALWQARLERGEERPNTISVHYGWEDYPGRPREEYPLEPRPAPEGEVQVGFALREYHGLNCMAEIPRLRGYRDGAELPGIEEANAPLRALEQEWKEYRASPEHEGNGGTGADHGDASLVIQSYPYSDSRWAQVVVTTEVRDGSWDTRRVVSVNWDREGRRAVPAGEMLAQLDLTQTELLTRLQGTSLSLDVFHDPYSILTPQALAVEAFRGREDGSAVFYLAVDCARQKLNDRKEAAEAGTVTCHIAYDTRDGVFRNVAEDLLRKWEPVELPQTDDLPLRWQEDVQSPML